MPELPDPAGVLGEVTTLVELAKDGDYMAGDRRVHHTERSRWRHTFRRLAADSLAAIWGIAGCRVACIASGQC